MKKVYLHHFESVSYKVIIMDHNWRQRRQAFFSSSRTTTESNDWGTNRIEDLVALLNEVVGGRECSVKHRNRDVEDSLQGLE